MPIVFAENDLTLLFNVLFDLVACIYPRFFNCICS